MFLKFSCYISNKPGPEGSYPEIHSSTEDEGRTTAASAEPARNGVSPDHQVRRPRTCREQPGVEGVQGGEGGAVLEQLHRRGHQQEQACAPRQRQEPGRFLEFVQFFARRMLIRALYFAGKA